MKKFFFIIMSAVIFDVSNRAYSEAKSAQAQAVSKKGSPIQVEMLVTDDGFQPKSIDVPPGSEVILNITRKSDATCSTTIQIPSLKIKKDLPLNQMVSIKLGKLKKGEIKFGCGMNMMDSGKILIK